MEQTVLFTQARSLREISKYTSQLRKNPQPVHRPLPNRNFEDTILWDDTIRSLSPEAFCLFFRMIMIADDFGIIPAEKDLLIRLTMPPNRLLRNFSGISQELPEKNLLGLLVHNSCRVYVIKPESWDRIQHYHIRKRTQSKYLKLKAEEADAKRHEAIWPFSENFSGNSQECLRNFLNNARAFLLWSNNNTQDLSSGEEENSEKKVNHENKSEVTTPECPSVEPEQPAVGGPHAAPATDGFAFTGEHATVVDKIVETLHRIGNRTGIEAYKSVSCISITSDIHSKAQKYGYHCLLYEAEKFETWFCEFIEQNPAKKTAKHKPKSRFLNTWMGNVDPKHFTSGDTEFLHEQPPRENFAHLVESPR